MDKRVKQGGISSLFALLWLLFIPATPVHTPSLFQAKSVIQKAPPLQKASSVITDLEENLEEEREIPGAEPDTRALHELLSLFLPEDVSLSPLQANNASGTSPTVGLFILYCSLRIPLPQRLG